MEKVYAFLYNGMTEESSYATISLHRTYDGAKKAMDEHKEKERLEFEEYRKRCTAMYNDVSYFNEEDAPSLIESIGIILIDLKIGQLKKLKY